MRRWRMTAMITEARRVTVRGTMAEGATIALWLAENCPRAARNVGSETGERLYQTMVITFDDDTEFAKFKLKHSEEFNEADRRQSEHDANRVGGFRFFHSANAPQMMSLSSIAIHEEEDDD